MILFFRRIYGMLLRHLYLFMCSWPRVLELIYWPFLNMVLWAFMSKFLAQNSNIFLMASGVLIASVIMWDTLFRGQLGVTLSFIEELWSRNLGNIAVSPLKPLELVLSLIVASFLRTLIGVGGAGIAAYFLFDFHLPLFGIGFVLFFVNLLIMGWALGLAICALLVRFGLSAETFAWAALFFIQPLCGVFYPISILPDWLQPLSLIIPATYIFEGMRLAFFDGVFSIDLLLKACLINVIYILAGISLLLFSFSYAKKNGLLLGNGE
jgi:ABC-2 type transport system permease protein